MVAKSRALLLLGLVLVAAFSGCFGSGGGSKKYPDAYILKDSEVPSGFVLVPTTDEGRATLAEYDMTENPGYADTDDAGDPPPLELYAKIFWKSSDHHQVLLSGAARFKNAAEANEWSQGSCSAPADFPGHVFVKGDVAIIVLWDGEEEPTTSTRSAMEDTAEKVKARLGASDVSCDDPSPNPPPPPPPGPSGDDYPSDYMISSPPSGYSLVTRSTQEGEDLLDEFGLTTNPGYMSEEAITSDSSTPPEEGYAAVYWKSTDHEAIVLNIAARFSSASAAQAALNEDGCDQGDGVSDHQVTLMDQAVLFGGVVGHMGNGTISSSTVQSFDASMEAVRQRVGGIDPCD